MTKYAINTNYEQTGYYNVLITNGVLNAYTQLVDTSVAAPNKLTIDSLNIVNSNLTSTFRMRIRRDGISVYEVQCLGGTINLLLNGTVMYAFDATTNPQGKYELYPGIFIFTDTVRCRAITVKDLVVQSGVGSGIDFFNGTTQNFAIDIAFTVRY